MGETKGKVKEMKKLKSIKENWDKTTQSADKKPEKYIKPDGKVGIRMVPVKKEGAMKRMATTQSNKADRMASTDKKGLQTYKKKPMDEKTLTPAEKKKREEIAKAMEKDNPGMDMKKKMAIATWQAKRVAEGAKLVEAQDPEMEKVKQLVRLGLMDKKDMTKIVRALGLMKEGKPVPQKERKILFDMLGELIGMITGDDAMFNKARKAVKEEKDMNGMCCKHCGDEFGKPKSESCMYDAYNPEGKNWIKKESYTEADAFGRLGITSPTMKHIDKKLDKVRNRTQTVMNKRPRSTMEEVEQVDEILDTPKAMQSYKDKAKYSRDRASGSATAKILSKGTLGSHKPELDTMRKRHKGMDMVDRLAKRKTFKKLRGEK